jgi:Nif-specific regulatory protein
MDTGDNPNRSLLVYFSLCAMQPIIQPAYLIIRQGNRWTDVFRLENDQSLVVGRASSNEISVADERASRRHAEIIYKDGDWILRDLGSRNGTLIDGSKIDAPRVLSPGNQITVASCRMTFVHSLSDYVPPANDSEGASDSPGSQTQSDLPPSIIQRRAKASMLESQETEPRRNDPGKNDPGKNDPGKNDPAKTSSPIQTESSRHSAIPREATSSELWASAAAIEVLPLAFELSKSSSICEACELALRKLLAITGCQAGGVIKLDWSTNESKQTRTKSKDSDVPILTVLAAQELAGKAYHPISDTLVQNLIRDPSAILARNVTSDPTFIANPEQSGSHVLTTTSLIAAPIQVEKSLFGVLHMYSRIGRTDLSPEDLEVALAIAEVLSVSIEKLSRQQTLQSKLQSTSSRLEQLEQRLGHGDWIGDSQGMKVLREQVRRVAPSQATVLIRGESGTGKELVARAIHQNSPRVSGPFVTINCAALSPSLLESELFGHEKGAFTGATDRKIGKFELADTGTMLLDELGEMSMEIQSKFLRVLEGHPFERLGSNKPIRTNVRIVAATNRDLEQAVQEGRFRSDLYFRLRVIELRIPPLRDRLSDVLPLAEFFLKQFKSNSGYGPTVFSERSRSAMLAYHWPGNVRELKNCVERAHVLANGDVAEPEDLALSNLQIPGVESIRPSALTVAEPYRERTLEQIELEHISQTLQHTQGQKNRAATILGIERSTLDRKLKRLQEGS